MIACRNLYLARPMGVSSKYNIDSSAIRPSAPLQYLLPAARVGVYVYRALALVENLQQSRSTNKASILDESATIALDNILLYPPSFILSTDPTVARGDPYDLPPIVGELAATRQKWIERKELSIEAGLTPQLFEFGQLVGERRQWNRLVGEERTRESNSEVRRALNIYTTNLNFDPNKYIYAGSKEEKSKLIRENRLPTATDVIRSDLDARDLYRNALQTSLDDAKAEYMYQKKNNFEDLSEMMTILRDARDAIDMWFSFIPERDVRDAMEIVTREEQMR